MPALAQTVRRSCSAVGYRAQPIDGSELAEQALPLALRWASALGTELLLVRVQPWMAVQFATVNGYLPDLGALDEQAAQAAADYLEERRQQVPAGIAVRTAVLRGEPASSLIDLAEQESVDVVVMSSHGRGGVRRLVLGSVADRLVRARLSMCVVHPAAAATPPADTSATAAVGEVRQE